MKKMMALGMKYGGMAMVLLAAACSDGGLALTALIPLVFIGLLTMLWGSFSCWKCAHPTRRPSVVRFRPEAAPALCTPLGDSAGVSVLQAS